MQLDWNFEQASMLANLLHEALEALHHISMLSQIVVSLALKWDVRKQG
jgi:hypothetical protein